METEARASSAGDFHRWAADQAMRLRAGIMDGLDRVGLASAVEAMAERDRVSARDCVRRAVEGILLCEHGPFTSRGTHMGRAVGAVQEMHPYLTPSLFREMGAEWGRLYAAGAARAAETLRDIGGDPADIPREPPWEWDAVFGPWGCLPHP